MIIVTLNRFDDFITLLKKSINKEIYYTLFADEGEITAIGLAFFGKLDGGVALYQIKLPVRMSRAEAIREVKLIAKSNEMKAIEGKIRELVMSVTGG